MSCSLKIKRMKTSNSSSKAVKLKGFKEMAYLSKDFNIDPISSEIFLFMKKC